jgi:hypothetical protein
LLSSKQLSKFKDPEEENNTSRGKHKRQKLKVIFLSMHFLSSKKQQYVGK